MHRFASSSNPFNQLVWKRGDYSDTLLAQILVEFHGI
jgi:hypothetical protein